jgi:signal transduction histidine kinase
MSLTIQSANEQKLEKAKSIIKWNTEVNEIILNAKSIHELFKKICKSTIETTKIRISFFTNLDPSARLETFNWSFTSELYLDSFESDDYLQMNFEKKFTLTNEKLATQYFCSNNIENDARVTIWKSKIIEKDYKSLFALPIIVSCKLITVMNFYSTESNYFTEDEINIILQLRDKIIFCINTINLTSLSNDLAIQKIKLLEECSQKDNEIDNFTYVLNHYIRNHVANIIGLNRLLLKEKNEEKSNELIGYVSKELKKLDTVIKDITVALNFRNNLVEEKELINLEELFQEIMHEEELYLQLNPILVTSNFSNFKEIISYRSIIKVVFKKFLFNAIRFTKENTIPIIEITSDYNNSFVQIHFKDYGIGIDLKKHQFDFNKNFNLNKSGKGFGLYMIKKHLDNFNGKMEVKSVLNKWTEFIIYLPIN